MTLTAETYLEAIARETDSLIAAADGNLAARVPRCPDWTVADLAYHVGDAAKLDRFLHRPALT